MRPWFLRTPEGKNCLVYQVLYHLGWGIEYSLKPWMDANDVALMAYCPLVQAGAPDIRFSEQELVEIDQAFPAPDHKTYLDIV